MVEGDLPYCGSWSRITGLGESSWIKGTGMICHLNHGFRSTWLPRQRARVSGTGVLFLVLEQGSTVVYARDDIHEYE